MTGKPWAKDATIDFVVCDGIVMLDGTVGSEHVRDAMRVAAENAPDVVRIRDNIRVVTPPAG